MIKLQKGDTDSVKHYIAQYESAKDVGDYYWMNFFHRTNSAKANEFSRMHSDGLVSLEEIESSIDPTGTVQSSSRTLKIIFNMNLQPYSDTLL